MEDILNNIGEYFVIAGIIMWLVGVIFMFMNWLSSEKKERLMNGQLMLTFMFIGMNLGTIGMLFGYFSENYGKPILSILGEIWWALFLILPFLILYTLGLMGRVMEMKKEWWYW